MEWRERERERSEIEIDKSKGNKKKGGKGETERLINQFMSITRNQPLNEDIAQSELELLPVNGIPINTINRLL